jgi:membrane fusion protein, multidrug efflux system
MPESENPKHPDDWRAGFREGFRDGFRDSGAARQGDPKDARGEDEDGGNADSEGGGKHRAEGRNGGSGGQGQRDKGDGDEHDRDSGGQKRNYKFLWILGAVAVVAIVGVLLYHFMVGRYWESTKDAYVNGNMVRLQPQVTGTVTYIGADQTQPVKVGQILVQLDPKDAEVALAQAKANLAQTVRDVVQLFADEKRQAAVLYAQQAQLIRANKELARDRGLVGTRGVSQEELERAEENARNAEAGIRQARASLESVRAQIAGTQPATHPRVLLAESNLRNAWIARNRTTVRSPLNGYMVRREVQLGQQVTPATEMLAITPLDSVWIDANFKETQLENIRINQPVTIEADIYGSDVEYHGRVLGLTAGTGSSLAVLPSENATGNWIKIVQRLPVRIGLDPRELRDHPLYLGLSTKVEVDHHDLSGASLSNVPVWPAAMQTNIYAQQDAGVTAEIDNIVRTNLQGWEEANGNPPVASSAGTFSEGTAPNDAPEVTSKAAASGSAGDNAKLRAADGGTGQRSANMHIADVHP